MAKELLPDKELFYLRYDALRANKEFWDYCSPTKKEDGESDISQPDMTKKPLQDIKDRERDILKAWLDFPSWSKNSSYLDKCLLFYGNIQRPAGYAWTRFKTSWTSYNEAYRPFPFQELKAGNVKPAATLAVAFDPSLDRKKLIRMFEKFLSCHHKQAKKAAVTAPFCGYFETTEKRIHMEKIARYIYVYKVSLDRPKDWQRYILKEKKSPLDHTLIIPAERFYHEIISEREADHLVFKGIPESRRRRLINDRQLGENISYWAVRGYFPKVDSHK